MWTQENRSLYTRKGLRYPSDLTDPEWSLIAPLIPPAKRGGRKREVDVREVLNAIWTCPAKVPDTYLIYAATFSNASGLLLPNVECLRRGL